MQDDFNQRFERVITLISMRHDKTLGAIFSISLMVAALAGCSPDQSKQATNTETTSTPSAAVNHQLAQLEVSNANAFALDREPVFIPLYDLGLDANNPKAQQLAIKSDEQILPSQLVDTDGDETLDALLFNADFASAQTRRFTVSADPSISKPVVKKQTQAEISIKEGGEWQGKEYVGGTFKNVDRVTPPPQYTDHSYWIRYEGPGIESDKVGYRIYLDWRNGFDIFGKKVHEMVLQNVGQDGYDSYHHNADWGVDVLKVGKSLGMGGFGFWNGKSVELVSQVDTRDAIITNNGDLYSGFIINYKGWQINDTKLDLKAHFTMTAGSRLVKVDLNASKEIPNFAIGMVKHPGTTLLQGSTEKSGYAWTYVGSWGKQSLSGPDDHLGMAIIFRRGDRQEQTEDESSYVSVMNDNGGNLEYYFLAAWEHELDGIKTEADFKAYLEREVDRLTKAPRIRFESTLSAEAKQNLLTPESALSWAKKLADSELDRKTLKYHYGGWDEYRRRPAKFEYDVAGLQIQALQDLNGVSPDQRYVDAAEIVTGSFVTEEGSIHTFPPELFSIDLTNPGRVLILLEQRTGKEKYRKAVDYLRNHLKIHPRTSEGAFWHRATYPNQLWLDGVYMGIPFLIQYASIYETGEVQHASFKEGIHEFDITRNRLRADNGLYIHAWDESKEAFWADKETGLASQYWSRGMGWLAMAMVDVLDYLPESETDLRKTMLDMVNEFAADIIRYQDPETGTWWQITDKPGELANYRESTGTAMFTYFLAKALNNGYLPAEYKEPALKAYQGLIKEFVTVHADGKISMTNQCLVAGLGFGRDGSYDYYMTERIVSNDPKGNGPFIMAGIEIYKLLKQAQ